MCSSLRVTLQVLLMFEDWTRKPGVLWIWQDRTAKMRCFGGLLGYWSMFSLYQLVDSEAVLQHNAILAWHRRFC